MLVCPLVFKTSEGGEELPRWVRFPHIPARKRRRGKIRGVFLTYFQSSSFFWQHLADDGAPRSEAIELGKKGNCVIWR